MPFCHKEQMDNPDICILWNICQCVILYYQGLNRYTAEFSFSLMQWGDVPMAGYVSDAVIRRLPGYYRHLKELEREGVMQISSQGLGERMCLTAS